MTKPITKSALARLKCCSPALVSKYTRDGCKLSVAVLSDGKIDMSNPAVMEFLGDAAPTSGADQSAEPPTEPTAVLQIMQGRGRVRMPDSRALVENSNDAPPDAPHPSPDTAALRAMSLQEVVDRYGHVVGYTDYVRCLKSIEETDRLRLQNAETEGRLISRELVQSHVFGALEGLTRRLLSDAPKTISQRLYSLAKTGAPLEEAEAIVREHVSSQIKPVKDKAVRTLREAGKGKAVHESDGE